MDEGTRYIRRGPGSVVHAVDGGSKSICGLLAVEAGHGWGGSEPASGPPTCARCIARLEREVRADRILDAWRREDWPQVIAYALQGRRERYVECGPEEAVLALLPRIGRRTFDSIRAGTEDA